MDGDAFFTPAEEPNDAHDFFTFSSKRQASSATSIPPPMRSISFLSQGAPSMSGMSYSSYFSSQVSPTSLLPVIQFSKEHEKRRRMTILVKVWLMIAGFYRKAHMLNDCREAIGEAQKYTSLLEKEVSKDATGEATISKSGWAGKKCVEELHGDCWAEVCSLFLPTRLNMLCRN